MMMLPNLPNLQKLRRAKRAIENFFYKARFNIALHQALHNKPYYKIRDKFELAIKRQVLYFAKVEKINEIIGLKKAKKKDKVFKYLLGVASLWVFISEFIKEKEVVSYLTSAANLGGQSGLDKLNSDKAFDLKEKEILEMIRDRVPEVFLLVDQTTQKWIAETIREGVANDLSSFEIAKLLKDSAQEFAERRASGIAENETALIMGQIELAVYEKNGIMYKEWVTAHDELVCIQCMANEEAGEIPIDEEFPDGNTTPPSHLRCRCLILPIIPKEMEVKWIGK